MHNNEIVVLQGCPPRLLSTARTHNKLCNANKPPTHNRSADGATAPHTPSRHTHAHTSARTHTQSPSSTHTCGAALAALPHDQPSTLVKCKGPNHQWSATPCLIDGAKAPRAPSHPTHTYTHGLPLARTHVARP
jgi:hypothetical protein